MKNLTKQLMLMMLSLVFIYSCSDDEEPTPTAAAPSISVSATLDGSAVSGGATVEVGDTLVVTLAGTTPGGFNVFRAITGSSTTEVSRTDLELEMGATSATTSLNVPITEGVAGTTVDWSFVVVDDLDQADTTTFSYTVAELSPDALLATTTLFGQSNPDGGSFFDLVNGEVYGYAVARDDETANVDFVFFYGSTSGYAIGAIDDSNVQTAFSAAGVAIDGVFDASLFNSTKFKALTDVDFDAIETEADLADAIGEVAPDASLASSLMEGTVFGFQLDAARDGIQGVVKVTETGGDGPSNRTITFDVKYETPNQ